MSPQQQAVEIANRHAASLPFKHDACVVVADLIGSVKEGWLFRYTLQMHPGHENEGIALAQDTGFLIDASGEAQELTTSRYMDLIKEVQQRDC